MSDAEWDAEDFQPTLIVPKTDQWEGEDEEDTVKDNWDDDENDEEYNAAKSALEPVKKKKTLKEKIAERELAKQKELEEKLEKQKLELEAIDPEKVKRRQEEADLELALEAFGLNDSDSKNLGPIELSRPQSKEEFNKFSKLLYDKIIKYKGSQFFVPFIENLFRDLTLDVEPEHIKALSTTLTALYNEKLKSSKSQKSKKTKKTMGEKSEKEEFADFADYM